MVDEDRIAQQVVDAGFQVHQALGPGLLESAYEECLAHELTTRDLPFERQVSMPISYKGLQLDAGYRMDLLVARCIVVEVKAVETMMPIHQAQIMTYLKTIGAPNRISNELQCSAVQTRRPPRRRLERERFAPLTIRSNAGAAPVLA